MNQTTIKLGYWAAVGSAATFVVFTICFVAILLTPSPPFVWTNMADFLAHNQGSGRFYQHLAQFSMLVFVTLYVVLLNSIHELAPADRRIFSRNSLSFGLMFAALSGAHYFVQITAVRFSLSAGQFDGLAQVLQANPHSAMSAMNMLGVTLFFGLSSLFVAPVFAGGRLEKVIRISFLLNGIFLLLGAVGYLFQWLVLLFVTVNLGMGGAAFIGLVALAVWFRRRAAKSE